MVEQIILALRKDIASTCLKYNMREDSIFWPFETCLQILKLDIKALFNHHLKFRTFCPILFFIFRENEDLITIKFF